MFDIIVVGAGPAGATFSRLASRTLKILLLDKIGNREKCCGGLIAPDAQKRMAMFDIGIPKNIVSDPQLFYVRSIDLESGLEQNYQRHYTNISRKDLDDYTLRLLPSNVTLLRDCRYLGHEQQEDYVSVTAKEGIETREFRCRMLVGADGANSRVRKDVYNDFSKIRKYLAIQGTYERLSPINHYAVFFDRRITNFYSWLIPKDDSVLVGGAFAGNDQPRMKYNALIESVKRKGYHIGDAVKIDACFLLRPRMKDLRTGKGNVALIGEAAGFISPSSSEGLSYAYESARILAEAVVCGGQGWLERYRKGSAKLKANIFLKNLKSLFMYNYTIRNMLFKLKIGSLKAR